MKAASIAESKKSIVKALFIIAILIPIVEFAALILSMEIGLTPARTYEYLQGLLHIGQGTSLNAILTILFMLVRAVAHGLILYFLPAVSLTYLISDERKKASKYALISTIAACALGLIYLLVFKYSFGDRMLMFCVIALLKALMLLLVSGAKLPNTKLILGIYVILTLVEVFFMFYLPDWGTLINTLSASEKSALLGGTVILADVWMLIPALMLMLPTLILWIMALGDTQKREGMALSLTRAAKPLCWAGIAIGFIPGLVFIIIGMLTLSDAGPIFEQFGILSIIIWCVSAWFSANTLMETAQLLRIGAQDKMIYETASAEELR